MHLSNITLYFIYTILLVLSHFKKKWKYDKKPQQCDTRLFDQRILFFLGVFNLCQNIVDEK